MTPGDFRRNFQQSYFGLHPKHAKHALSESEWASLDLSARVPLIPCTNPSFNSGETRVDVFGLFRIGDVVINKIFNLKWTRDMDEDTSIMLTKAPMIGAVQHATTALFLRRQPVRQFNRGYVPRVCTAHCSNSYVLSGMYNIHPSDQTTVWRVFNPLYFNYKEALENLYSGKYIGVALSRLLTFMCDERRRFPLVYYRDNQVGFVQGSTITVYDDTPEPVRDYIYKITKAEIKVK